MAHASNVTTTLPDVPTRIRERYIPYRAEFIDQNLRALAADHPGLLDAMWRSIQLLESTPGFRTTTVDFDEEDILYPVTVWARTSLTLDERDVAMLWLETATDQILEAYPDLVLVAIL